MCVCRKTFAPQADMLFGEPAQPSNYDCTTGAMEPMTSCRAGRGAGLPSKGIILDLGGTNIQGYYPNSGGSNGKENGQ